MNTKLHTTCVHNSVTLLKTNFKGKKEWKIPLVSFKTIKYLKQLNINQIVG